MAGDPMFVLTDVSPYADGPAGVHGVLGQARTALCELASMTGLEPTPVDVPADLAPAALAAGGVLALFTIGETSFSKAQRAALVEAWVGGRLGVLGVHSATDACHTWDDYGDILGARFDGHPWTTDFSMDVVDGAHPATAHLAPSWAWHDEVYLFARLRPDARVLLRLAEGQVDMGAPGARRPECGFPLAWCLDGTGGPARDGGPPDAAGDPAAAGGRTFYSALGHFPTAWESPDYLRHLLGGLAWLVGHT